MIKVLIVDDEKATRDGLKEFIPWQSLGVDEVNEAADGVYALELALKLEPDIILCDIRMPRMDGIELATILKNRLPDCKVIFLSGYSDKEYLKSAIQLQAIDYVEKPVNVNEVSEVIQKTVAVCLEEKERRAEESGMRVKLEESLPLLHQKLAIDLVSRHSALSDIKERLDFIELNLAPDAFYTTILFKLNLQHVDSLEHQQAYIDCVLEVIEQEFTGESLHFISGLKEREYVVVHVCEKNGNERRVYKSLLGRILEKSDEILSGENRIFISVGKRVRGIEHIYESYQTAVISLQKQFYIGYRHVVFDDEKSDRVYVLDESLFDRFDGLLKKDCKDDAILMIKRMTDDIRRHEHTLINYVKNIYLTLSLNLSRVAEERNIRLTQHENEKEYFWDEISRAGTLAEIEDHLIKKIERMFYSIAEKENKSSVVFNVSRYIQENFHDKNLSIKTIADYAYLTPTYLCLVFKKETGKTINQYITEVRIEKSKEYLKDRKIKIYEIANRVGYSDPNYYAKVFEKMVGLNPSDFREKYLL